MRAHHNALMDMRHPHYPKWEAYSRIGGKLPFAKWLAAGRPKR